MITAGIQPFGDKGNPADTSASSRGCTQDQRPEVHRTVIKDFPPPLTDKCPNLSPFF
jgi:hypothetical protein